MRFSHFEMGQMGQNENVCYFWQTESYENCNFEPRNLAQNCNFDIFEITKSDFRQFCKSKFLSTKWKYCVTKLAKVKNKIVTIIGDYCRMLETSTDLVPFSD